MRYTRRVLDRQAPSALIALVLLGDAGIAASCSSEDDPPPSGAATDASSDSSVGDDSSAPQLDATLRDAGPYDATAPAVVCASASCATSLTTTLGIFNTGSLNLYVEDPAEGFCALLKDGTVACWGANGSGQLGRGEEAGVDDSARAERVTGVSEVTKLRHTCALDKVGAIWCWGTGPFSGDVGAVSTERTPVKLPLPAATNVAVSFRTGCATIEGAVSCWGSNEFGQVERVPSRAPLPAHDVGIPPGAAIRDLVVGQASFALRQDGTVVSWGANPPLGRSSGLFPDPHPQGLDLANIDQIDIAYQSACAAAGGVGYCWGRERAMPGDVGRPRLGRALPEPVVTPEPIRQISTTNTLVVSQSNVETREPRWCATGASGAVYCAGENASGQAGDGTKNYALKAVKVTLPEPAVEVKVTPKATCALLTTGQIYCWGSNYYGELGSGKPRESSLVPRAAVLP